MTSDQKTRQGWKRGGTGSRAEAVIQTYKLLPPDGSWIRWSALVERAKENGPSKPTLSQHLRFLENMGEVERREDTSEYPHPVNYKLKTPSHVKGERQLSAVIQETIEGVRAALCGMQIIQGVDEKGKLIEREEPLPEPLTPDEQAKVIIQAVYGSLQDISLGIYYEMLKFKYTEDREAANRHLEDVVRVVILSAIKQITEFAAPYLKGDLREISAVQHASLEGIKNFERIWDEANPVKVQQKGDKEKK